MKKQFNKYMAPFSQILNYVPIVFGVSLIGYLIYRIICGSFNTGAAILTIVLAVFFILSLVPMIRSKLFFKSFDKNPERDSIVEDFEKAVPMRKDTVRFGEKYVFVKHSGKIVRYADMTRVFQYIHKTDKSEEIRILKYYDKKGKDHNLCKLEPGGAADNEVQIITTIILSRNPNVKVGDNK